MQTIQLIQGSKEWHEHRANHFNASDLPAIMNLSSYKTRDEALKEYATGERPEINSVTQRIFDKGHEYEAMARKILEDEYEEEFYPVVAVKEIEGLKLSASLDGVDLMETTCFEHKSINEKLRQVKIIEDLDMQYIVQMEQQLMVSDVPECIFIASDGTKENRIKLVYKHNGQTANNIMLALHQFAKDIEDYEAKEVKLEATPKSETSLPALNIEFKGAITSSNLNQYHVIALNYIDSINTDLITDQNFADAETDIKNLKKAEKELKDVEQKLMTGTVDLAKANRVIGQLKSECRDTRLMLEKTVKAEKQNRKLAIANEAKQKLERHIQELEIELQGIRLIVDINWNDALKNIRTISSLENAANSKLAEAKIEANEKAQQIRSNLALFEELIEDVSIHLFADKERLMSKDSEDLRSLIIVRLNEEINRNKAIAEQEEHRIKKEIERKEAINIALKAKAEQDIIEQKHADELKETIKEEDGLIKECDEVTKKKPIEKLTISELSLAQKVSSLCDVYAVPKDFNYDLMAILESYDIVLSKNVA